MKDQKQKKDKKLGVEGTNPIGQNPDGENPNFESPKKESDASLVPYLAKAANHDSPISDDDSYFESLPPGFRFKPRDGELMVHYLRRKIHNQPLPPNQIKVVELYRFNPNTLTEKYKPLGEMEWYFFTPRDRKYPNGQRPNRAAADGYWKATGADRPVKHNGNLVGFKKALVFYKGKAPKGDKTSWIMHEYRVNNPPLKQNCANDMRLDDWVLCRIYKKTKQFAKASTLDQQPRSEVPTSVVHQNPKMLPTREILKFPEGHGNFDVSEYYNLSAYDNVLLSCQNPYFNFQNGQVNSQNWLPSIPQPYHHSPPLGFPQMLHQNPPNSAAESTILAKDQTSPMKPEQFGCLPDELLNLPWDDSCFDPLAHNLF